MKLGGQYMIDYGTSDTTTPYYCPQFPVIVHSSISGIIDYKTLPQIDLYIVA